MMRDVSPAAEAASRSVASRSSDAADRLLALFREVLEDEGLNPTDNIFERGATSLEAVYIANAIEEQFGSKVPLTTVWGHPTAESLARELVGGAEESSARQAHPAIVELRAGDGQPLVCIAPVDGNVFHYALLARYVGGNWPVIGLRPPGLDDPRQRIDSVEELADYYLQAVRSVQPHGPYFLCGYSFGAPVAFEIDRRLRAEGETIGLLAVLDDGPVHWGGPGLPLQPEYVVESLRNVPFWVHDYISRGRSGRLGSISSEWRVLLKRLRRILGRRSTAPDNRGIGEIWDVAGLPPGYLEFLDGQYAALIAYQPTPSPARVTLFRARAQFLLRLHDRYKGWGPYAHGGVELHVVPGSHGGVVRDPGARVLAREITRSLRAAQR
ncbi:MAG: hypothetical protein JO247_17720 [Chloroflexi bacterium]|nr:hypothetical protein [Chloroflexota bacterium]